MPALIFDCDGVLADTEMHGHLPAFNATFAEFGIPLQWGVEEYGEKVLIGGGKERMLSALTPELAARSSGVPADEAGRIDLVGRMHRRKTELYTQLIAGGSIVPRPGVARLAAEADTAGWSLAVASTSAEPSVRAVLVSVVGPALASRFAIFAGDIVAAKKPAPDIYLFALSRMGITADDAVVIEDSGIGVRSATGAGVRTVVTVSAYTDGDDFTGAALVLSGLGDEEPGEELRTMHDPFGVAPGRVLSLAAVDTIRTSTPSPHTSPSRQEQP